MGRKEENSRLEMVHDIMKYKGFIKDVPEELRKVILEGRDAPHIYKKFSNLAAVRAIQIIMTNPDDKIALAAAKEILDRQYGRATERKHIKHELEDASDDHLRAILASETTDLDALDVTSEAHAEENEEPTND